MGLSGRTWQLDPVDGTLNFALGLPGFCTSMALMEGDEILAACVYQPLMDDGFTATLGRGRPAQRGPDLRQRQVAA